jgi:hypothetical protein
MNINDRGHKFSLPGPDCFEITDAKFHELFDSFCEMIEDTNLGRTGSPPTLALYFREMKDGLPGDVEGAILIIGTDFNDGDKKRSIMEKAGKQAFLKGWILVAVMMSSEAWMSQRKSEDPDFTTPPSKDPNRKECLAVAGRTLMGECRKCWTLPVDRDKDNRFVKASDPISSTDADTYLIDHVLVGFMEALQESLR